MATSEDLFQLANQNANITEALRLYTQAANQGHVKAQFQLALLYEQGIKVPQNYKQALYWYQQAAEQNHLDAIFHLGVIYEKGYGETPINVTTAIKYYTTAADQYHKDAAFNLAVLLEKGYGGTQIDIPTAIHYYTIAANQDHQDAAFNLAVILEKGYGNTQINVEKATHYYKVVAEKNHFGTDSKKQWCAAFNLAVIYEQTYRETKNTSDLEEAIRYYEQASKLGHAESTFNLSILYKMTDYCRNAVKSIKLLDQAFKQGYENAKVERDNYITELKHPGSCAGFNILQQLEDQGLLGQHTEEL